VQQRRLDLGRVETLVVESFGEPGQRTFRILAGTSDGQVSLWLEKEQVVMLGNAISELLSRVSEGEAPSPEPARVDHLTGDLEVKIGSLAVGFDVDQHAFSIEASDFESPFQIDTIALLVSRGQLVAAEEMIETIVSASRPRCLLCGRPLTDEPHFCPPSNGHTQVVQED